MQRVVRYRVIGVAAVICTLFFAQQLQAQSKSAGIFSGPDLGKYFSLVKLPEYPWEARRNGLSGRGTYRAHVEATGKVTRVEVVQSTGHKILDEAVVSATYEWRARPGRKREIDFPIAFQAPYGGRPPPGY
jgi:TonB family protein